MDKLILSIKEMNCHEKEQAISSNKAKFQSCRPNIKRNEDI